MSSDLPQLANADFPRPWPGKVRREDAYMRPQPTSPRREETAQGRLANGGVVAVLGALAAHRPEAILDAMIQIGDESNDRQYKIRFHKVDPATPDDPVARPTGDTITFSLDDKFPVATDDPRRPLVGIQAPFSGWPALLEKVVAAQDQAWDAEQQDDWNRWWLSIKPLVDAERRDHGLPPSPMEAPTGYNRLDMGTDSYQRATLLAEISGEQAEVRTIPEERQGEQALLGEFRERLADGKPIVVISRVKFPDESEPFPRNVFAFGHVYEVVRVGNETICLRNPWGADAWGRPSDPPPVDAGSFWEYYRAYNSDGSRPGHYSTLT